MRADEEASSLLRIASRPNTARVGVMVFMLSIVWAGALASVAVAQEACNIQDVAIDQVDSHVPVDSTEFEGFLDAGRASDQVAVRAWSVEGGGAGLVLFLFEEPRVTQVVIVGEHDVPDMQTNTDFHRRQLGHPPGGLPATTSRGLPKA